LANIALDCAASELTIARMSRMWSTTKLRILRSLTRRESGRDFEKVRGYLADVARSVNQGGPECWRKISLRHCVREIPNFAFRFVLTAAHPVQFPAPIVQSLQHRILEIVDRTLAVLAHMTRPR
jgi:hypothetical protein